jgi:hypothetical protein
MPFLVPVLAWMRIAGDDEEPPNPRQRGDDLLDHRQNIPGRGHRSREAMR